MQLCRLLSKTLENKYCLAKSLDHCDFRHQQNSQKCGGFCSTAPYSPQCYSKVEAAGKFQQRLYSTTTTALRSQKLYEDETIPMPFGVLGARRWGDPSKSPILLVHGWKDNLASFDRLIPLLLPSLQDKYFFLAVDLPGHGFSSHFPPGMLYQVPDCLVMVARILRHYNWKQPISYIGHSLGGIIGFIYSATNPGVFKKLVALDNLTPFVFSAQEILTMVPAAIADTLKFEDKLKHGKPPLYSYEDIFQRLMQRSVGGLDEISAKVLLSRGICEAEPGSGRFHFTHDIRVQFLPIMMLGTKQIRALAKNYQSDLLYIIAKDGVNYGQSYIQNNLKKWMLEHPASKPDRKLTIVEVEGYHHVHLMSPETVAPHVIEFFKE